MPGFEFPMELGYKMKVICQCLKDKYGGMLGTECWGSPDIATGIFPGHSIPAKTESISLEDKRADSIAYLASIRFSYR